MGRFPWVWLLASILLLGSVLSQSEEDDGDLEDSHVEIEPEDGDEPKKGQYRLHLKYNHIKTINAKLMLLRV